jgi:hypothetical protein
MRRALFAACAVLALSLPALAQQTCPPRGGMAMLSSEQRLMMMADARKATADGSLSMRDYRAMQRDKLKAMTPEQRQAWAANLTTEWNALSPAEQQKLKADAEAWRKQHEGQWNGNCPPPDHG